MGQLHMWPETGTESVLKITCLPILSYPGVGQGYSWQVRLLDLSACCPRHPPLLAYLKSKVHAHCAQNIADHKLKI